MKSDEYTSETESKSYPATSETPGMKARQAVSRLTSEFETKAKKLPPLAWFGVSAASMLASALVISSRKTDRDFGSFVGLWAPCFMLVGVYAKLVEIEKKMTDEHARMPAPNSEIPATTSYLS